MKNIFDNNVSGMKRYLVTVNINNYQKPIIKELYVGRTADGGHNLIQYLSMPIHLQK